MRLISARGNYYQVLSMEEMIQTKMSIHNSIQGHSQYYFQMAIQNSKRQIYMMYVNCYLNAINDNVHFILLIPDA